MLLCNKEFFFHKSSRHFFIAGGKTHVGYFRRCGLDLSLTGAVVIALLVMAGTRVARAGFEGSRGSG
jgi:hypothetical protein